MATPETLTHLRPPKRADARRNYEQLIAAARGVFAESGSNASLEEIARQAGVGIGTLYRHFPTRQALLEAVYVDEVEALGRSASELADLAAVGSAHRVAAQLRLLRDDQAGARRRALGLRRRRDNRLPELQGRDLRRRRAAPRARPGSRRRSRRHQFHRHRTDGVRHRRHSGERAGTDRTHPRRRARRPAPAVRRLARRPAPLPPRSPTRVCARAQRA